MFLQFFSRKHEKKYVEAVNYEVSLEVELINLLGPKSPYMFQAANEINCSIGAKWTFEVVETLYEIRVKWQIRDDLKRSKAIDRDSINS